MTPSARGLPPEAGAAFAIARSNTTLRVRPSSTCCNERALTVETLTGTSFVLAVETGVMSARLALPRAALAAARAVTSTLPAVSCTVPAGGGGALSLFDDPQPATRRGKTPHAR